MPHCSSTFPVKAAFNRDRSGRVCRHRAMLDFREAASAAWIAPRDRFASRSIWPATPLMRRLVVGSGLDLCLAEEFRCGAGKGRSEAAVL